MSGLLSLPAYDTPHALITQPLYSTKLSAIKNPLTDKPLFKWSHWRVSEKAPSRQFVNRGSNPKRFVVQQCLWIKKCSAGQSALSPLLVHT